MSKTLDTVTIKETYETKAGAKKTRETYIKAMDNDGSQFVNIHSGRGSVCVSKAMIDKVASAMKALNWKGTGNDTTTIEDLQKQLAEVQKQLKKASKK